MGKKERKTDAPSPPSPAPVQPAWDQRESAVSDFLVAAKTTMLRAACDLLFIHGNDLVWDSWIEGLYLAQITHEDRLTDIMEVMQATAEIAAFDLFHAYAPKLRSIVHDAHAAVAETGTEAAPNKIVELIATEFQHAGFAQFLKPANDQRVDVQKHFTQFLTLGVGRGALALRQRILGATGLTTARYSEMLDALKRLGACEPVFRVAFAEDTFSPEWSMTAGSGFRASPLKPGASALEVYRIALPLAETKRGQDVALALFIAALLNRGSALHRPVALACYLPKGKAAGEMDVWIERLQVGCEVKLYQAPAVQTANKIAAIARDLERQLPTYFDLQCERFFYVTNLPERAAASVLEVAGRKLTPKQRAKLDVVTGRESVLSLVADLSKELAKTVESEWEAGVRGVQERARKNASKNGESQSDTPAPSQPKENSGRTTRRQTTRQGEGRDAHEPRESP